MSIYFNYVLCLNPKQIDKTDKTLLDLRAKCVRDRVKLHETHSVKGQVSNAGLKNVVLKKSLAQKRAMKEELVYMNC